MISERPRTGATKVRLSAVVRQLRSTDWYEADPKVTLWLTGEDARMWEFVSNEFPTAEMEIIRRVQERDRISDATKRTLRGLNRSLKEYMEQETSACLHNHRIESRLLVYNRQRMMDPPTRAQSARFASLVITKDVKAAEAEARKARRRRLKLTLRPNLQYRFQQSRRGRRGQDYYPDGEPCSVLLLDEAADGYQTFQSRFANREGLSGADREAYWGLPWLLSRLGPGNPLTAKFGRVAAKVNEFIAADVGPRW